MIFESEYSLGDEVIIEGGDTEGLVISIMFRSSVRFHSNQVSYEVCWWASGVKHSDWFEGWRLNKK